MNASEYDPLEDLVGRDVRTLVDFLDLPRGTEGVVVRFPRRAACGMVMVRLKETFYCWYDSDDLELVANSPADRDTEQGASMDGENRPDDRQSDPQR